MFNVRKVCGDCMTDTISCDLVLWESRHHSLENMEQCPHSHCAGEENGPGMATSPEISERSLSGFRLPAHITTVSNQYFPPPFLSSLPWCRSQPRPRKLPHTLSADTGFCSEPLSLLYFV